MKLKHIDVILYMEKKWHRENMIEAVIKFYESHKRTPRTRDAIESNGNLPVQNSVRKIFGKWSNLIEAVGLTTTKNLIDPFVEVECKFCGKAHKKARCKIKDYNNSFCSSSCCAKWINKFGKRTIHRRSRLEIYIQKRMLEDFPNLIVTYNDKTKIGSELDIYIDSIKLAFELNGIFHYEPIHGKHCLDRVQNNDHRKFQACLENDIELCIIDSSSQRNYNDVTNEKFYSIIQSIVQKKLILDL